MAKKKRSRDYKQEYQRRIARGLAKGRSRSQSRGHPKRREKPISKKTKPPLHDPRIAQAVAKLFRGKSLSDSATESGVSPERLRKVVKDYRLAIRRKGKWKVSLKKLAWEVALFTRGRVEQVQFDDPEEVSRAMSYMASVRHFKDTQDISALAPYRGETVRDLRGTKHPLETRENVLYRLSSSIPEREDKFYRPYFRQGGRQ
jgi:hypothetical protein